MRVGGEQDLNLVVRLTVLLYHHYQFRLAYRVIYVPECGLLDRRVGGGEQDLHLVVRAVLHRGRFPAVACSQAVAKQKGGKGLRGSGVAAVGVVDYMKPIPQCSREVG